MQAKNIIFGGEIYKGIARGADCLANAVKTTLGPKGRYVVVAHGIDAPLITKDGATVARHIELVDKLENVGAQAIKEVALRMEELVGDGTTTATVIAQAILQKGMRYLAVGINPRDLIRGINLAVAAAVEELHRTSLPCNTTEDIHRIATISANGDRVIGDLLAEAIRHVGKDGVVEIEESESGKDELFISKGISFDHGFSSPRYSGHEFSHSIKFEEAYICLAEQLSNPEALLPLLEQVRRTGFPLLVIAGEIADSVLSFLSTIHTSGALQVCAVKTPALKGAQRDLYEDIAVFTGAKVISNDLDISMREVTLAHLGKAKKIVIDNKKSSVIGGYGDRPLIHTHVKSLQMQLAAAKSTELRSLLRNRIAKLVCGIAVIKIGGSTKTAIQEKKWRATDALQSVRGAMAEGYVVGGGVALMRTQDAVEIVKANSLDIDAGIDVVLQALTAPLCQIAINSGAEPLVVSAKVRQNTGSYGYNAATDEYGDLAAMGVLDATVIVRTALQQAASVSCLVLTTDCVVVGLENA